MRAQLQRAVLSLAVALLVTTSLSGAASRPTAPSMGVHKAASHSGGPGWAMVTGDYMTHCGLKTDHTLWCWGWNRKGATGTGSSQRFVLHPRQVGDGSDWVKIGMSDSLGCGLRPPGTLWCWGENFGDVPQQMGTAEDWNDILVSGGVVCPLDDTGALRCWETYYGPAGESTQSIPGTWASVSDGNFCGVRASGALGCWNYSYSGDESPSTHQVGQHTDWTAVTAEGSMSSWCASRESTSNIYCFGKNQFGQLGIGRFDPEPTFYQTPVKVVGGIQWKAGTLTGVGCGLNPVGKAYCWGGNIRGYVGDGTTKNRNRPTAVKTRSHWRSINIGGAATCAIAKYTRDLYCWGDNWNRNLGVGLTVRNVTTPHRVL